MPQRCSVVPDSNTVKDPRASIISNLELIEISALCTKDSAVAIIKHRGGKYLLVSQYMDINLDVRGDHVDKILNYAAGMNIPLLMGADTNSHTILFGPDSNRRGLDLEELLVSNGLRVENIGTMPTYETIRGSKLISTCIDATFSRDMDGKITSWMVDDNYNGSDHNTILFKLKLEVDDKREERNWNAGRWGLMKSLLAQEAFYEPSVVTEKKLDRCLHQFYKKLNKVLDQVCPKKKMSTKVRANIWYNKNLKEMAKRIKKGLQTK